MKRSVIWICILACTMARAQGAYIDKVYAYTPSPGQFINQSYPTWEEGDSYEDVLSRVDSLLRGATGELSSMVCLGAWGGSITFGFDHDIVNISGKKDLIVYGNTFYSGVEENGYQFGSAEPGIIWVSADANGNGLPDDQWYEIAGSESGQTQRGYAVTYHYSTGDIQWEDNQGKSGVVKRNIFHTQLSYYPAWREDSVMTVVGSLLPSNLTNEDNPRAYSYAYGYADNRANNDEQAGIDLDWAIREDGSAAGLTSIRFVRVQTGVLADWGISGEISTEITGARDLHARGEELEQIGSTFTEKRIVNGQLQIERNGCLYSIMGIRLR